MYYYGARYYDPKISMWYGVDPLAEKFNSWTPYNYTLNNPILLIDPDGERPTPSEAAAMADDVYNPSGKTIEGGWSIAVNPIEGMATYDSSTGFKSSLYERQLEDGSFEYAYVTAGTGGFTDYPDNKTNTEQALQGLTEQYGQSIDNARALNKTLEGKELSFVGHSLGGGLASANSLATGRYAITFNAAGLSSKTKNNYNFNSQIDAYIVGGEFLDNFQRSMKELNTAEGSPIYLIPASNLEYQITIFGYDITKSYNSLGRHSMNHVKEEIEQNGY